MVVLYSDQAIPAGTMAYAYFPYDAENRNNTPDKAKIVLSPVQGGAAVSAMPLAGIPFKVEEEIAAGAQTGNGAIKFLNLGSVINYLIFSSDKDLQAETIKSVQFEAAKPIAGVGHIDLTAIDTGKEGSLVVELDDAETVVKVVEDKPVVADKESAEPVKMVVLPGTFGGTLTVTTDVAIYTKTIPEREFGRSHSRSFNLDLAKAEREEVVEDETVTLPYTEAFTSGKGKFSIVSVNVPAGLKVWTFESSCAKASAYVNDTFYATESWLVSPWLDLTEVNAAAVSFDHFHRYTVNVEDELTFWAKSDEEGAGWKQLSIPNYASGEKSKYVDSGDISLAEYIGKKVKVGFKYTSTDAVAATWQIMNFSAHTVKVDPELSYETTEFTADVNDDFISPALVNPHGLTVTYSSNNEEIAKVDKETGEVSFMGDEGVVTITATFAGDDIYAAGDASYTITVTDGSIIPETFFYESFNDFPKDATGGNDGQWDGSVGNYSLKNSTFDEGGWAYDNSGAAYKCVKVGSRDYDGTMTTRTISVNGKAKLTFRAAGWGDSSTHRLSVTATGAKLAGDTEVTMANGVWTDFIVSITEATGEVVLTFTGHRFFLDEIAVFTGDAPVKPDEKLDPGLAYEESSFVVLPGAAFTAPKLINPYNLLVTYSSSDEDVAQVDQTTGKVVIGEKEGLAVITASFTGTYAYYAGSASYRIVVRGENSEIMDVLDRAFTGVSAGSAYTDWSGKSGASGALYAGNSAGGNSSIQITADEKSGIVTTTSGGKVTRITVTWNQNTDKARVLQVYGSNTPYKSAGDLYDEATQGKLVGKLTYYPADKSDVMELAIEGDFEYIGLRSADRALYLDEIDIFWK